MKLKNKIAISATISAFVVGFVVLYFYKNKKSSTKKKIIETPKNYLDNPLIKKVKEHDKKYTMTFK